MPASTAPGTITNVRSGVGLDNITYTIPITVPTVATAGTVLVNGAATLKYYLVLQQGNISAPTGGTVTYVLPIQSNGDVTSCRYSFL